MANLRNAVPGTNPNSSVNPRNRKNSRKNSRKNNRKQRGGAAGIFHSRLTGPAGEVLRAVNGAVGGEIEVVRNVVHHAFDGAADALNAIGQGADGIVRGLAKVVTRKNRKNNRSNRSNRK